MVARRVISGLPVYNGQKYIAAAIESHLAQSFGDFELVISDNGSTDATPDICAEYARKDERVTLLRSPENRGILWNHRRVMESIDSPDLYFRWAGADDIVEPRLFEEMVRILDTRPEVGCVVPDTRNIDETGQVIGTMPRSLDLQSPDVCRRAHDVLVAKYQHVIAYGLLRASTLCAMRTGPHYPGWDAVFTWEFALRGLMVQTDGVHLLRRFHTGSISRVKTAKELRKWVEPNAKAGMSFPHWTWTYEYVRTLMAAPMTTGERLRIARFLARVTIWKRGNLMRDVTQAIRRSLGLSDEYTF
jgi:glycosyltransferase involved in cell wall biosynthesis